MPHAFIRSVDFWISSLDQYDLKTLLIVPAEGKWSMGQLYVHLIESTEYFLEQAECCLDSSDHSGETCSVAAKKMFAANDFPDILIEGPSSNDLTKQPADRESIRDGFERLRVQVTGMLEKMNKGGSSGKTRHPGLGWFSAGEWLQFAEMHLRHHQRQKKRIDQFLQARG